MANQRILIGTAATVTSLRLDADGVAADAAVGVHVTITRGDGTVIVNNQVATHGTTGQYTYAPAATLNTQLDLWKAVWTDDTTGQTWTTYHDIVGAYVATMTDIRAFEILSDAATYPNATVIGRRAEAEDELERLRRVSFVPRYARLTLNGNNDCAIATGLGWLRAVRSVTIYTQQGSTSTAFSSAELAACQPTGLDAEAGRIVRADGYLFPAGTNNVVIEVEHGYTGWGSDLRNAFLARLRYLLTSSNSALPQRAKAYTNSDGQLITLTMPDSDSTGMPEVDAVYGRYPIQRRTKLLRSLQLS